MTYVQANPGRFAVIAGILELDGDVVRVDGRPLAELLRHGFAYDPTDDRLGHLVVTVETWLTAQLRFWIVASWLPPDEDESGVPA
jgi:hypothetical protein